jgi:hypothetical protein
MASAGVRVRLRPHGFISFACFRCPWFDRCGGIEPEQGLFRCFELCRGDCRTCDRVCPHREDFFECLFEIRGFRYKQNTPISQKTTELPRYVPMIHHGGSRAGPLELPVVALSLYQLFRLTNGYYRCIAESARDLRDRYKLAPRTRVLIVGTGKDRYLERYWRYRRRDRAPAHLPALDIDGVVAPNYSHFLDVPRTDNLFNRKRQLICIEELQQAGVSPIPHLNAVTRGDWEFWKDYLRQNTGIRYVSVEFQTGNKNRSRSRGAAKESF